MKITGRIIEVSRCEKIQQEGPAKVYGSARVAFDAVLYECSSLTLYGYEPEVKFEIGQKVTIELEDVGS